MNLLPTRSGLFYNFPNISKTGILALNGKINPCTVPLTDVTLLRIMTAFCLGFTFYTVTPRRTRKVEI